MSKLTVALLQHDIHWLDVEANLAHLAAQLQSLPEVDLILLSETFATGFAVAEPNVERHSERIIAWLKDQAQRRQAVLCASVISADETGKFNRLYWVQPSGKLDYYDKRHLFCLGKEGEHMDAGTTRKVFTVKGVRVLPQICYDLRFGVFQRNRNDYDVMVNIANWPAARRDAWDTLLKARAIENQCYVLAVNRVGEDGQGVEHNGGTAAYRFDGKLLAHGEDNKAQTITVTLDLAQLEDYKESFPAWQDADDFELNL